MAYAEIEIRTTTAASEAVADRLTEMGAVGTSIEDPADILELIHEPGSLMVSDAAYEDSLPPYATVRAWFPEAVMADTDHFAADIDGMLAGIGAFLPVGDGLQNIRRIEESDWANTWKAYYHPTRVTEHLVICPTWETYEPQSHEKVMKLDPGSAFGTGSHASTAMMLELMETHLKLGARVLDVGCGSGILSIAAALAGAEQVDAVDVDAGAVRVAAENIEINACGDRVRAAVGELGDQPDGAYDVILMNITADVIAGLIPDIRRHLRGDARFLCSGIIEHKAAALLADLRAAGWIAADERRRDGWRAFVFR